MIKYKVIKSGYLDVVQPALPPATGHLELPAVSADLWPGLAVVVTWGGAEVLASLSLGPVTLEKDALVASWPLKGELVEGDAPALGSDDAGASGLGELESADGHLWNNKEPFVVDDLANNNSDGLGLLTLEGKSKPGDGVWTAVSVGKAKAMSNLLVEVAAGAAGDVAVKVEEHLHVNIGSSWLAAGLAANAVVHINTHGKGRPLVNNCVALSDKLIRYLAADGTTMKRKIPGLVSRWNEYLYVPCPTESVG